MATFLETTDATIFIDPAVSIAPVRYGLPPHEVELRRLNEVATKITSRAYESEIIVVTHYHYDHHDLGDLVPVDIYKNKIVLIKDPKKHINVSQRIRAAKFLKRISGLTKEVKIADSSTYVYGNTIVKVSHPTPHGPTPKLGYVIQVLVRDSDKKVLFTSDVEGPVNEDAVNFMIDNPADLVIVDGPPTYLFGVKKEVSDPEIALRELIKYLSLSMPEYLVIDHHLLRDLNYTKFYESLKPYLGKTKLVTAAEFMGREPELLEARRKELYGG
ncbi:MAG: MBL fold metallo-hydrolase [Zestosphaera sp.]